MTDPLLDLAALVERADGVSPLNEASRLAIKAGERPRVDRRETDDRGRLAAAAYGPASGHVEVFVAPDARRQGRGARLISGLIAGAETAFWAHGDLPAAQALAARLGLERTRVLLVLERDMSRPLPVLGAVEGVTIRTWQEGDLEGLLAVNERAFADHPEQGAMDAADTASRMAQPWFDPLGLFIAERDGEVIGFHWTKVEDEVGEVYVVGVDPDAQGLGLGKALTLVGLHHLAGLGLKRVELYVEGDNEPALSTYRGLGFTEHARDAVYSATRV